MGQLGNQRINNIWKQMKMKAQHPKTFRMQQNGPKREVYRRIGLLQEARENSNTQLNLTA